MLNCVEDLQQSLNELFCFIELLKAPSILNKRRSKPSDLGPYRSLVRASGCDFSLAIPNKKLVEIHPLTTQPI